MANNRQAETLAYFMANPGEYLGGNTIEDCAEFTQCSISTVYNHVRVLKTQGIIKDCGINVHDPNRRGLYLDPNSYKASMNVPLVDASSGMTAEQYDVLNDKLDIIMNILSTLKGKATSAGGKSNKVKEPTINEEVDEEPLIKPFSMSDL